MVENQIMDQKAFDVARNYITYRYVQSLKRQSNTTDERILTLIECNNEDIKQENSNKNPTVNSVQRDYMAGEVSKDLTERFLLPPDIVQAHKDGIIHFHDADYFAQHMHNCDLVNLEDMLQNGTVISGTLIEKPHSFSTACNIATQIIAQVASSPVRRPVDQPDPSRPLRRCQPQKAHRRGGRGDERARHLRRAEKKRLSSAGCGRRSTAASRPSSTRSSP